MSRRNRLRVERARAFQAGPLHSNVGVARLAFGFVASVVGGFGGIMAGVRLGIDESWGPAFYALLVAPFVPSIIFLTLMGTKPWFFATSWWVEGASIRFFVPAPRNGSYSSEFANRDFVVILQSRWNMIATRRDGTRVTLARYLWSKDRKRARHTWKLEADGRLSVELG